MLDYTKKTCRARTRSPLSEITATKGFWKKRKRLACQERKAEIKAFLERLGKSMTYQGHLDGGRNLQHMWGIPWFLTCRKCDERHWNFQSIATTDIVAHPQTFWKKGSDGFSIFARVAIRRKLARRTVQLAQAWSMNIESVCYLCRRKLQAPRRWAQSLASQPKGNQWCRLLPWPRLPLCWRSLGLWSKRGRDQETSMQADSPVRQILEQDREVKEISRSRFWARDLSGSRTFSLALAHDPAQIFGINVGKSQPCMRSCRLPSRSNPSSIVKTNLGLWIRDSYTRQYDLDLVREVAEVRARQAVLLTDRVQGSSMYGSVGGSISRLTNIYRAFPYIIYGQLISLLTSLKVQNRPVRLHQLVPSIGLFKGWSFIHFWRKNSH